MIIEQEAAVITMLIVEDERVFRQGLRAVLEPFADQLTIVGEATNAEDAIASVTTQPPDLVLLDLRIPQRRQPGGRPDLRHGVETIMAIARSAPATRVLVLSNYEDDDVLFAALRAGAHGYIAKSDNFDGPDLFEAVASIVAGEAIYGPAIAERIRAFHQGGAEQPALIEQLTPREREVLDMLVARRSNNDIAHALVISVRTVKTHVANILAKLHLTSRYEVPLYVRFHGDQQQPPSAH